MPFYPRERGIVLPVFAKNGGVNAPLLSSPSHSWSPDPKIYKSSAELLFSYCSIDFSLPSVSLLICVGGRVIFLPSILAYTNFHFVYEMCLTKISSETELSEPNCPSMFCWNSTKCRTNIVQTLFALHKFEILDLPCLRTSKLDLPVAS